MIRPFPAASRWMTLLASVALAGCEDRADDRTVEVTVIGGPARLADLSRNVGNPTARVLMSATAQGLVRFDAAGQVEPALAERWIVIDNGRSYILRLGDNQWSDGTPVTAGDVVAALRRVRVRGSRNPALSALRVVDEVVEMTPQVVEIRLRRPQPEFLRLLAQPELAIFRERTLRGTGPFEIAGSASGLVSLRPVPDPATEADESPPEVLPEHTVRLRGARAALAIAQFAKERVDLVLGGDLGAYPLLRFADLPPNSIRLDPAAGLFGLAVTADTGFLAEPANRMAVFLAFDRTALTAAFRDDWQVAAAILPAQLDSGAGPALSQGLELSGDERLAIARARMTLWQQDHPEIAPVRVALSRNAGGNLLWSQIAGGLGRIGLRAERVAEGAEAELRVIDLVAPLDSARWYLTNACVACSPDVRARIDAAAEAPDAATRGRLLAEADAALAADFSFLPIARPLRWSLVAPRLEQWTPNPRAWHPLNHLRAQPN